MDNFKTRNFFKRFDHILFFAIVVASIIGMTIIASATATTDSGSFHYVRTQMVATLVGIALIFWIVKIDMDVLGKFYIPIYVISNLLMVALFVFGSGDDNWGATRWIRIGPVGFQPAEIVKLGIVISLAKLIDNNSDRINEPLVLLKILAFISLPTFFIFSQPDLGTAIIFIFFTMAMLFFAGLNLKYIFGGISLGILSLPIMWMIMGEYQKSRVLVFLDPSRDPLGTAYQVTQSKIAIGAGQVTGMGLFNGNQTQFGFLPEKHTDFIFAVLGEELGLIGGLVMLSIFFIIIYRLLIIAKQSTDLFGSLIVIGITSMIFFHVIENIGMNMGVAPVTGIPLPFISYGGTYQLITLISMGLALNVSTKRNTINF